MQKREQLLFRQAEIFAHRIRIPFPAGRREDERKREKNNRLIISCFCNNMLKKKKMGRFLLYALCRVEYWRKSGPVCKNIDTCV